MSNQTALTAQTQLMRNPDIFSSEIDENLVVMDMEGNYFALNLTAQTIWELLENPCSYEQLLKYLFKTYDIESQPCRLDVETFLTDMLQYKLILARNS
ncbi:MAG: hypothetical protein A3F42_06275 [Gammaproteobacteria bacterium RIFCSPHIGHO2_12_FULL_37_34]|nr:MAG: hypothetical protein A3F42_06275 [Gammaproteobacteria bacterium RIFCSPHIGHO2_12_FULL_37_34]